MIPAAFAVAAAVRWLSLVALAALLGILVLDVVILPVSPDALPARRRLRTWSALCAAILLAASAGELVVRARTMSGGPLAVAFSVLPVVLTRTHFGRIWLARLAALVVTLALSLSTARRLRGIALILALGLAATTSLTGHAGDWGDLTASAFVDWGHVVAASAWTGGLLGLALALSTGRRAWPPPLFAAVVGRFSRLAGWCLAVVAASGIFNASRQIGGVSQLCTTTYGRVLVLKLLGVAVLVALGALNRYGVLPKLDAPGMPGRTRAAGVRASLEQLATRLSPRSSSPASRLAANVAGEILLAALVFACTAALGELMPARRAHAPEPAAGHTESHHGEEGVTRRAGT
jgi:putative copper export protein